MITKRLIQVNAYVLLPLFLNISLFRDFNKGLHTEQNE